MSLFVAGDLSFASYYRDHMVLQRAPERAVVWGYGPDGAQVTVSLTGGSGTNIIQGANVRGEHWRLWSVKLADIHTDD